MAVPGGYAKGVYVASFIGMVPADHPRLVVLCAVNGTPEFGGTAAAPAVKRDHAVLPPAPGDRAVNSCPGGLVESAAMKLSELVEGVSGANVRGDPGTEIRGLAYHTRDVADGTLFFCVPGLSFDGHTFAAAAVEAGRRGAGVRARHGSERAAGHRPLRAPRHGARGGALVRRPLARSPRRRRHRHQRQDDHRAPRRRPVRRGGAARPGCWARSSIASAGSSTRSSSPRPSPSTCSACSERWSTPGTRRARSRSARTPCRRTGPPASTSTPWCSAT